MKDLIEIYSKTKKIYEKSYDINICGLDEIQDVKEFIDLYWQKNHILTRSKDLLNWQHLDMEHNRYNFIIARCKKTSEIHGILGFILSSIYDTTITTPIRWGAIWKVREEVALKGLGIALKAVLEEKVPTKYIGGVGLSKYSKVIDEKLGERMGKLQQFYMINPYLESYQIVVLGSEQIKKQILEKDLYQKSIVDTVNISISLSEKDFISAATDIKDKIMPYKSIVYYVNRYYRHPIYQYKCFQLQNNKGLCEALFFVRICKVKNNSSMFIVDYIGSGNELIGKKDFFVELMKQEKVECISFPCDGIEDEALHRGGFSKRLDSDIIIPVYYEPFLQKNVDLEFHFWSKNENNSVILVKGDADQDRPNLLPEEL